jgi:hypothetical protein
VNDVQKFMFQRRRDDNTNDVAVRNIWCYLDCTCRLCLEKAT